MAKSSGSVEALLTALAFFVLAADGARHLHGFRPSAFIAAVYSSCRCLGTCTVEVLQGRSQRLQNLNA